MAQKRKKATRFSIAGVRIPRRLRRAVIDAIQTPLGRVILAEAFIQAAALLVSKHPTAAAAAAGASTATAATNLGSAAREAAVDFMQGTCQRPEIEHRRDGALQEGKQGTRFPLCLIRRSRDRKWRQRALGLA